MPPWRPATPADDPALIALGERLYAEDPTPEDPGPRSMARTLAALRADPRRGLALALDLGDGPVGYALLIAFWSNELGGDVITIDELYVAPPARGRGHSSALIEGLAAGALGAERWPERPAALTLEVTPTNAAAMRLYERLGFRGKNLCLRRPLT
jgi:ribosomal protein S18 acetylase RimI-like enzyme